NSAIHELFRNADIYVFPSYHEGFPRVLYEAMTFSVPIVTTDIPGTEGVMKDSENCLKVKPKSDEELENAVEKLLKDEELRKTIGLNGYAFMEKYFSKIEGDSHAKQLVRWMEKVDL
ncbi:MAG: glycosyltransferase family 4 protein, partial [bacterium]